MASGKCPVCDAITSAEPGEPTPLHQPKGGGRDTCPGSGQPAKE